MGGRERYASKDLTRKDLGVGGLRLEIRWKLLDDPLSLPCRYDAKTPKKTYPLALFASLFYNLAIFHNFLL